jgi:hypothetical protein
MVEHQVISANVRGRPCYQKVYLNTVLCGFRASMVNLRCENS